MGVSQSRNPQLNFPWNGQICLRLCNPLVLRAFGAGKNQTNTKLVKIRTVFFEEKLWVVKVLVKYCGVHAKLRHMPAIDELLRACSSPINTMTSNASWLSRDWRCKRSTTDLPRGSLMVIPMYSLPYYFLRFYEIYILF